MELLDAEFKKTLGEVNNLTRSTMMQSQRDLMNMLNEAEMRVAAGVQSYSAAVCDILDQYGRTGVMIDYPTGTRRTLEAAVRMCVVTSMNQTAAQVTNHYIAEHNVEYVLVSAHLARGHREKDNRILPVMITGRADAIKFLGANRMRRIWRKRPAMIL